MPITRTVHSAVSPEEASDRLALRELFDAYAHCADRRDAEGQISLFTPDTTFGVFMSGPGSDATYTLQGRESLAPVFADLKHDKDSGEHKIMVASLR